MSTKIFKIGKDEQTAFDNGFKCKMGVLREYFRTPHNVAIIATISGTIHEDDLIEVLKKVTHMHPLTRVRVVVDNNHDAWFTDEGVASLSLKVINRTSNRQWIDIIENEHNIPFDFESGPLTRFILLKSKEVSDLIVICNHSISDGLSLSNITQDIMFLLSSPETPVKRIDPILPVRENLPAVSLGVKLKLLKNRLMMIGVNRKWNKQRVIFDEVDYQNVHEAYTQKYTYRIIAKELSESQTSDLVTWCHQNNVTVNSALSVAFLVGRHRIRGESASNNNMIQIAVNIRDQLKKPGKQVFGFLASNIQFEFEYLPDKTFLDNVKLFHEKVLYELKENKALEPLIGHYTSPTLIDGINFATHGGCVHKNFSQYGKLSRFIQNETSIAVAISKQIIDNTPGLVMSNLGNVKNPKEYGSLKLDRLYLVGHSSPFSDLGVVVITASGKLTLTQSYMEDDASGELGVELEKIAHKSIEQLNKAIQG